MFARCEGLCSPRRNILWACWITGWVLMVQTALQMSQFFKQKHVILAYLMVQGNIHFSKKKTMKSKNRLEKFWGPSAGVFWQSFNNQISETEQNWFVLLTGLLPPHHGHFQGTNHLGNAHKTLEHVAISLHEWVSTGWLPKPVFHSDHRWCVTGKTGSSARVSCFSTEQGNL